MTELGKDVPGIPAKDLLEKLGELEILQWTSKIKSEVRKVEGYYEYNIVFKDNEDAFFAAIIQLTSMGYETVKDTALLKDAGFIVLMRRLRQPAKTDSHT